MYRIVCLVLCLVAASYQHNITKFEVPDAVEVGGNAELVCEHNATGGVIYVKWWWAEPGVETPHQIYQRVNDDEGHLLAPHKVDPPLNITLSGSDNNNILLWNLQPQHSGEYSCEVTQNITEERRKATDLVVYSLGSGPLLNMTKFEGESDVQVTCEAVGVAPEPDITISFDSNSFNASTLHGPSDGLFNVFANATVREEDLEGKEIFCKLSFKQYDIEIPAAVTGTSFTYHSDAWRASSTEAPETTETPPETPEQLLPGGGGRADSSWVLLAALAIPAHMLALL